MADLLSELEATMDSLVTVDVHAMAETQLLTHTETLLTEKARLDAALAIALQSLDTRDVTVTECGRQTRGWLVEDQHVSVHEAKTRLWVARHLVTHPDVAEAFRAGRIGQQHVQLLIGCLQGLPAPWREAAQAELLAFAQDHDPGLLAHLCRQLRIRTGADDDDEAAAQRQHSSRYLNLLTTFEGMYRIEGMLDPAAGTVVQAALESLMAVRPDDDRTPAQRRADALAEIAEYALRGQPGQPNEPDQPSDTSDDDADTRTASEAADSANGGNGTGGGSSRNGGHGGSSRNGGHGGRSSRFVITIPFDELINGLPATHTSAATLNGTPITPATARMFACDTGIIPAVLGGNSEVLDLGRSQRLFSPAQKLALELEHHGCGWPKCQIPIRFCVFHYILDWALGGNTNKKLGVPLCRFHHWLIHHTNWKIWRNPDGNIEVARGH